MLEKIREIAARIRDLREITGLTTAAMAADLGLPVSEYEAYEQGSVDVPASRLWEIANRLHVDMTDLLTGEAPRMHVFAVTRNGQGPAVNRRRQYRYQSLAANFIHKKAEPFLVTVEPCAAGTAVEKNSHPGQEFDYVIEGTLAVLIHEASIVLNEGDSIFFDASYPHGMHAVGATPCRFLAVIL